VLVESKDRSVIQGRWKLVYQPLLQGYLLRLYDTVRDPDCMKDVLAHEPAVARMLAAELREFLQDDDIDIDARLFESASTLPSTDGTETL
jgi:hypothetical protein